MPITRTGAPHFTSGRLRASKSGFLISDVTSQLQCPAGLRAQALRLGPCLSAPGVRTGVFALSHRLPQVAKTGDFKIGLWEFGSANQARGKGKAPPGGQRGF